MIERMTGKKITLKTVFNIASVLGLLLIILLAIYGWNNGFFESLESLRNFVQKAGIWGPVAFVILQIVQVVIPIIPGGISLLAGVFIFGPVEGFAYNYIGIAIGSVIAFLLARGLGITFLQSISPKKIYDKFNGWLDKKSRFDTFFAIAILLPVAPDDFLCMLAGITKMKLEKFIAIILLCKPLSIAAYSFGLSWIAGMV
jgi:uncharacterized membrane protein YdjX (TVP38/TMEM64 family)